MITNLLLCIAILAGAVACVAVGAAIVLSLVLRWAARGESDVNGDPERDALGLAPHVELPRMICQRCKCVLIDGTGKPIAGWCAHCLAMESKVTGLHPFDILNRPNR
ncbi:MAG: hypothetical protein ABS95_01190 [Verrucomicrobia bacterium SCN 57-15]|nr:MAG: hypothetical protein ABS95_01190 [Verrucomicrobia bacterium SCN 57-15]